MASQTIKRGLAAFALVGTSALVLTGCSASDETASAPPDLDCSAYAEYGDLAGTSVSIYSPIAEPEATLQQASFDVYSACTGGDVVYEGSDEFEAQLGVRVRGGNAPDVAFFPQPGLLTTIVEQTDAVVELPELAQEKLVEYFPEEWQHYGKVDGVQYGVPVGASVKSLIWYSPTAFTTAGYEVPKTWDEMFALMDQIVADGAKPWSVGLGSGDATGWVATDWLENIVMREGGQELYEAWYTHEIPFNDPRILEAMDTVASIIKDHAYVNGGLGDVTSIATTNWIDAGTPILNGTGYLYQAQMQAAANWPEGTEIGPDGDVYAFYLPAITEKFGKPVLGGGEFAAAFDDRNEVQMLMAYLASPEWATERALQGSWLSANTGLSIEDVDPGVIRLSAEILQDPETTFFFDASDLMPGEVGAGTFWSEMTDWFAADKSSEAVIDAIEESWPTN